MKGDPRIKIQSGLRVAFILFLTALIAGCSSPATPTLVPTVSLPEVQVNVNATMEMARTQAAQTVVADITKNAPPTSTPCVPCAPTLPPPTATQYVIPTATFTPIVFTPTITRAPATATLVPTSTPVNTTCQILEQAPSFGADFPPNADFDGRWRVKNISSQTWAASAVDVRYLAGTKFQTRTDGFDLPADVAPNGEYTVIVDMRAPNTTGRFSTTWGIVQGGTVLCSLPITLDVVR